MNNPNMAQGFRLKVRSASPRGERALRTGIMTPGMSAVSGSAFVRTPAALTTTSCVVIDTVVPWRCRARSCRSNPGVEQAVDDVNEEINQDVDERDDECHPE